MGNQEKIKLAKASDEDDLEHTRTYMNLKKEMTRMEQKMAEIWRKNVGM